MPDDSNALQTSPAAQPQPADIAELPSAGEDPLAAFPEDLDLLEPLELGGQSWQHAFQMRLNSRRLEMPGLEDAALLSKSVAAWRELGPEVTAESILELLIARASLVDSEAAPILESADALTPRRVVKILENAEFHAALRSRRIKQALRAIPAASPEAVPAMAKWLCAELPPAVSLVSRRCAPTPWDARNDGHLVRRASAWALGIIRWARTVSRERSDKISLAFAKSAQASGLYGQELRRASLMWAERRPVLFVARTSIHAEKLLHDMWLADPSVGLVSIDARNRENPAAALGIPFISDPQGFIAAHLGLDRFPVLIEPSTREH